MKQNFFGKLVLTSIVLAFVIGFSGYLAINFQSILNLSLGNVVENTDAKPEVKSTQKPIDKTEFIEIEPTLEPYDDYIETVMEFPSKPVEFLEEILPQPILDPDRESASVVETVVGGGTAYDNFFVKDTSNSDINILEHLKKELPFDTEAKSEPTILIYHTHTCESYMTGFTGYYYTNSSARSTDQDKSVVAVGDAMTEKLESYGFNVIHDTTTHDSPEFTGAYQRSMDTVAKNLEKYPSIKITIDIHRDCMEASDGTRYKPTVEIDGKNAAQVMILAGCDVTGEFEFDRWEENLILDLKIQQMAEDLYPNLMRPLMFGPFRYNMNATNASFLMEVGTDVNTMQEAIYSGSLMGDVLAKVLLEA